MVFPTGFPHLLAMKFFHTIVCTILNPSSNKILTHQLLLPGWVQQPFRSSHCWRAICANFQQVPTRQFAKQPNVWSRVWCNVMLIFELKLVGFITAHVVEFTSNKKKEHIKDWKNISRSYVNAQRNVEKVLFL